MDSSSNPNPWPPYDSYKDCSLGICSIYCPQYCYLIFPPPPPSSSDDDDDNSSGFSPLVIAVISILASAFFLVSYYMLVTRYCRRRRDRVVGYDQAADAGQSESTPAGGLEEALIKAITVYKFKKGEGLVEGSDCSVCLSEFEENESLRLMPKCSHAFHLPCIDTWLKSHSSCPLCRSNIAMSVLVGLLPPPPPPPQPQPQPQPQPSQVAVASSVTVLTAHEYRHQAHDTLLVISRSDVRHEAVIDLDNADSAMPSPKDTDRGPISLIREDRGPTMRRSASFSPSGCSTIFDAGGFEAEEGNVEIAMVAVGTTTVRSGTEQIKRSISTERFMPRRYGKGRNFVYPI